MAFVVMASRNKSVNNIRNYYHCIRRYLPLKLSVKKNFKFPKLYCIFNSQVIDLFEIIINSKNPNDHPRKGRKAIKTKNFLI